MDPWILQSILHLHTKISFNIHTLYDFFVLYNEQRHVCAFIYVQYLVLFCDIEIITNNETLFLTIFLQIKFYVKRGNEKNHTGRWEVSLIPFYSHIIYQKLHNWQYITYLDMRNPVNISWKLYINRIYESFVIIYLYKTNFDTRLHKKKSKTKSRLGTRVQLGQTVKKPTFAHLILLLMV